MTAQKDWTLLIRPEVLRVAASADPLRVATVVAEPLEHGFGVTLANALRRILFSSIPGAAVQTVHIDGVLHEFTSIPGIREDVSEIVLNVKDIAIKVWGDRPRRLVVKKRGPGRVTAADIQSVGDVVVLNPELVLCNLDEGGEIRMELAVSTGKGYVPAERNRPADAPLGLIPVDSLFSPVRNVSYKVENTREGEVLDYDKLTMSIVTNGAISPEDALAYAARILQDQLNVFTTFEESKRETAHAAVPDLSFDPVLLKTVDELELSHRSANSLKSRNIVYIGDLVQLTEAEMLMQMPNLGRKALNETKEALVQMGLYLGMEVPGWPPENIKQERYFLLNRLGPEGDAIQAPQVTSRQASTDRDEDALDEDALLEEFILNEALEVLDRTKKSYVDFGASLHELENTINDFEGWARETRNRI